MEAIPRTFMTTQYLPAIWLLAAVVLGSCSAAPPRLEVIPVPIPSVVRDLDGDSLAPVAQNAYLDAGTLNIESWSEATTGYRRASIDGVFFAKNRTRPAATPDSAEEPVIVEVTDLLAEDWDPQNGIPVPVFDATHGQEILESAQVSVTPADRRFGSVVNVLDEQDLFHYYDEFGTLRTVPLVFKPDNVRVSKTYRLDQVIAHLMPEVRQTLTEGSEPPEYALLNTGDESEGGYPFVFLDFGRLRAFFLRSPPTRQPTSQLVPASTTIEAATHLTTSHVRVIVEQPVSALARLLTLATRSTTSMLDPRGRLPIAQEPVPPVADRPGMDLTEWESKLDKMTGTSAPKGHITTLIDGDAFFPRLIDSITDAKKSLRLRTYIFDNDDYALTFADFLKRRSAGIDVRIMFDGLGSIGAAVAQPDHQPASDSAGGSIVEYLGSDSDIEVRVLANPWLTGDHTKSIIVDDRVAFVGGMNIGR